MIPFENINDLDEKDQKKVAESVMSENFPVSFNHNKKNYRLQLTNLSQKGAFIVFRSNNPILNDIEESDELFLRIHTPYGKSECTAKVQSIDLVAIPPSICVEFVSISNNPSDPLRCAMASPL